MTTNAAPRRVKVAHVELRRVEQALKSGMPLRRIIPLQPRKVIKKAFWGLLVVLFAWAIISFGLWHFWLSTAPIEKTRAVWTSWALVLLVLVLWRTGYHILYFFSYFYDVDDKNMHIRKGVVAKKEITLPFSRITDVYIDQDMLDVIFGLYDVHMSSPTEQSGRFAHIDGIDKRGAVQLRALLLDRINTDTDDTVAGTNSTKTR